MCTTVKDVSERIGSWVRWHVWLGFERLILFFDDASETDSMALARSAGGDAVELVPRDEGLRERWAQTSSWHAMRSKAEKDIQTRQLLNTQARANRIACGPTPPRR